MICLWRLEVFGYINMFLKAGRGGGGGWGIRVLWSDDTMTDNGYRWGTWRYGCRGDKTSSNNKPGRERVNAIM